MPENGILGEILAKKRAKIFFGGHFTRENGAPGRQKKSMVIIVGMRIFVDRENHL
jgi:hypothetical protein